MDDLSGIKCIEGGETPPNPLIVFSTWHRMWELHSDRRWTTDKDNDSCLGIHKLYFYAWFDSYVESNVGTQYIQTDNKDDKDDTL